MGLFTVTSKKDVTRKRYYEIPYLDTVEVKKNVFYAPDPPFRGDNIPPVHWWY